MSKQWVKQELHKNEAALILDRAVVWVLAHKEASAGIGLTAAVALALAVYSFARYREVQQTAWERLAVAQSYAFAGQADQALQQTQGVVDGYPRSRAAGFAVQFQGDLLYRSSRFKDAIAAYEKVFERKDPALVPYALAGIAQAQESGGDFPAATAAARRFLEAHQDHFLAPQVQSILARSLQAQGRLDEARSAYENISLLYPETFWATAAQQALKPPAPAPKSAAAPGK